MDRALKPGLLLPRSTQMGLWDTVTNTIKAQFLDVLQWLDDSNNTLVWRFPIQGQAIQDGGKLVVREGKDHGWPEMAQDAQLLADWFDTYLRGITK